MVFVKLVFLLFVLHIVYNLRERLVFVSVINIILAVAIYFVHADFIPTIICAVIGAVGLIYSTRKENLIEEIEKE